MEFISKFTVCGDVIEKSPYMTVYRKGYMLVIEFITNAFIPLMLTSRGVCGYGLSLWSHFIFDEPVAESDVITAKVNYDLYVGTIEVVFFFGDSCESPKIEARISGEIIIHTDNVFRYDDAEVLRWALAHGIDSTSGAVVCPLWYGASGGYDLVVTDHAVFVEFPNNMQFSVVNIGGKLCVLKTPLQCDFDSIAYVFVRAYSCTLKSVTFRMTFVTAHDLFIVDDIVLDELGATCGDQALRMSEIVKRLVLFGGSSGAVHREL